MNATSDGDVLGWAEVTVGDIAASGPHSLATGPFGSSIGSRFFQSSGIPVIRGGNLSSDTAIRIRASELVFLSKEKAAEFPRSTVRRGDLVFTCWGTINQVGLIDDAAAYPEYVISNKQMKLTPDQSRVSSEFLYFLFSGPAMQREILTGTIGSSIPGFNLARLRSLKVHVPPLAEQLLITEALSDADKTVRALERLIAKKQAIKLGTMQQLLTGKARLPGFIEPWKSAAFQELAAPVRERTAPKDVSPETRLVELEHIESGGGRLLSSATAQSAVSLKTVFQPGDVLFGKLRAYLRKYWLADSFGICSTEIWVLRAKPGANSGYIRYLVETDRFIEIASGGYGTHMPRSDWGTLRGLQLAVPSLGEQKAIASILRDMDDEIDLLHYRLTKVRAVKQGMMQELLTGRTRLRVKETAS